VNEELVESISNRYIELYEHITGRSFIRTDSEEIYKRCEKEYQSFKLKLFYNIVTTKDLFTGKNDMKFSIDKHEVRFN